MKRVSCSNCLLKWPRWAFLARSDFPRWSRKKKFFFWPNNSFFIRTKLVSLDGRILADSYLLFRGLDFVSVRKNAKRRRPISSHFDLTLSHCYYATLKISLRELPYGMLIVSLWVFGMESLYLPTQVSFSTVHKKKNYKKCPDTDQTEISLRGQLKLEPHPHLSPFGI